MTEDKHDNPFVSRGGLKLAAALEAFALDVSGFVCADLGCNVGGFTDCLLQRGARQVYAADSGYGVLAWELRKDPRVVVMERRNVLHLWEKPEKIAKPQAADLVVMDLGWTPQRLAIPAALRWKPGRIVTLVKPHYEDQGRAKASGGVLGEAEAERVVERVLGEMRGWGVEVRGCVRSPILGGGSRGRGEGNREWLALVAPI